MVQPDGTLGVKAGCQWYVDAENVYPVTWPDYSTALVERVALSSGNRWLAVRGIVPAQMPAQGVGYWSPWLGAVPGVTSTVTLKMRGNSLAPSGPGGPAVYLEYINETGRNRQRRYLVGYDEGGAPVRPELLSGTYGWTSVSAKVVAPTGAVRMALFMGLKPATGEINFDDVDLKTDSYVPTDPVYYLPFEDPTNGLMSYSVWDGAGKWITRATPFGYNKETVGFTNSTPSGTGWALDLPINPTNHPIEGPALAIDGSPHDRHFQLSRTNDAITIAMWVFIRGYDRFSSQYQGLVNNNVRTDHTDGWYFGIYDTANSTNTHSSNAQLAFVVSGRGARRSGTTITLPLNTWAHVAVTWKAGVNNPSFYINGQNAGSTGDNLSGKVAAPCVPPFPNRMVINLYDAQYVGVDMMVDNIRIYKRELALAEIQALYVNRQ